MKRQMTQGAVLAAPSEPTQPAQTTRHTATVEIDGAPVAVEYLVVNGERVYLWAKSDERAERITTNDRGYSYIALVGDPRTANTAYIARQIAAIQAELPALPTEGE